MILFISDLHLQAAEPETARAFREFLAGPARQARELWILGDLFELWTADDDLCEDFPAGIADALAELARSGVAIRIVVGNRDFMLGKVFEARSGARIVPEPAVLEFEGKRLVLLHGDAQCTDDVAYQRYRRRIRSPFIQALQRNLPYFVRRAIVRRIRQRSVMNRQKYGERKISDVNAEAIAEVFRATGADIMIHGHTHQPACHALDIDGRECQRWVLADWHGKATWLEAGPQGLVARTG